MTKPLELTVDKLSFLLLSRFSKDRSVVLRGRNQPKTPRLLREAVFTSRAFLQAETSEDLSDNPFNGQRCDSQDWQETEGTTGWDFLVADGPLLLDSGSLEEINVHCGWNASFLVTVAHVDFTATTFGLKADCSNSVGSSALLPFRIPGKQ